MKTTLIVIEDENDHAQAKALAEELMASGDARDAVRLAAQARLIEAYERNRWPRRVPATADILSYLMEQHSLSRADLIPLLGTASRVSEVLAGKRELSMTMVLRLRERFHVSADALIPRAGHKRAAA
ncbi:MAG TPA: hypothetical protein VGL35_02380 [Rhizomicrobium sp.]|jgi:HTH-type transcriptional regulator/antitoxin HigA